MTSFIREYYGVSGPLYPGDIWSKVHEKMRRTILILDRALWDQFGVCPNEVEFKRVHWRVSELKKGRMHSLAGVDYLW